MTAHSGPARAATYRDVLDAPPHMVAEVANGLLHLHPRPPMRHARASFRMAGQLDGPFFGQPGGWQLAIEPELHLGPDIVVPDLAGWRLERMPAYPDAPFFTLAPDWACEIVSPGTRRFDLTEKRTIYGANGVGHLWLVDPDARTLEAFALAEGFWTLVAAVQDGEDVRAAPFASHAFPLAALWPDPEPDPDPEPTPQG
ncbi:Uma2 family endonuclease [Amaricoccus sp.]|uniref:Uma2 family endonuclease n=1 Tax=Amaricoccus sp. TaxID=1872485 RepID=UPI001B5A7FB9|nr:Uma2 family endonuclease [Amaricoccus sp.]MBP7001818.1 Uma2 family endonuclease [Amaricoccus sp.]